MAENEVETLRMAAAILRLSKPELIERFGENPDAHLTLAEEQFALVEEPSREASCSSRRRPAEFSLPERDVSRVECPAA
jgi:hypothetical protein